jgi:hypothetical protein
MTWNLADTWYRGGQHAPTAVSQAGSPGGRHASKRVSEPVQQSADLIALPAGQRHIVHERVHDVLGNAVYYPNGSRLGVLPRRVLSARVVVERDNLLAASGAGEHTTATIEVLEVEPTAHGTHDVRVMCVHVDDRTDVRHEANRLCMIENHIWDPNNRGAHQCSTRSGTPRRELGLGVLTLRRG